MSDPHVYDTSPAPKPIKPIKPKTVYRIIDRGTGKAVGSYSRSYHDEYDFESASSARHANCHGEFEDTEKYAIAKYRVVYELIEADLSSTHSGGAGDG